MQQSTAFFSGLFGDHSPIGAPLYTNMASAPQTIQIFAAA